MNAATPTSSTADRAWIDRLIRNQRMLDDERPDLIVAFPGGRGTADLVGRAKAAGVRVVEVKPQPAPKR